MTALWHQFRRKIGLGRFPSCPATELLLLANAITFLTEFFAGRGLWAFLDFEAAALLRRPYSLLTYPFHGTSDFVSLLLMGYVFWWVGRDLERTWGTREFTLVLASLSALGALTLSSGFRALAAGSYHTSGLGGPLLALVVAWCMRNPNAVIHLFMVLPVRAQVLGTITLAGAYFTTGPILGLFALVAPLAAWWYAARGRRLRLGLHVERKPVTRSEPRSGRGVWHALLHPLAWLARRKRRREFDRLIRFRTPDPDTDRGRGNPHDVN